MCGIIGIIGSDQAAKELVIGSMHLQHRGKDAAGILVFDFDHDDNESGVKIFKNHGLISQIFSEENLKDFKGSMGIAHCRYPTSGFSHDSELQPFFLHYPDGIGMAHNGNIVNYVLLRKKLKEEKRRYLASNSDTEALANLFAEEYSKEANGPNSIFNAVEWIFNNVFGSYSVVSIVADKGILAFRDPNGIRPLVFGKRKSSPSSLKKFIDDKPTYCFASESIALSILGFEDIEDVKPGEVIFIDKNLNVHRKQIVSKKHAHCIFEYVYFATVESEIEGKYVYELRYNLGKELAEKIKKHINLDEIDIVVPVPDTSRPAAAAIARDLGKPLEEGLVKNRYVARTFIMPSQTMRENAVSLKMKPISYILKNRKVLIVDDSIVRGTTSKKIISMVRQAGAKKVYFVSTFPPIRHPCYYGIDFQSRGELVASNRTIEEIERELGADKLIYIGKDSLIKAAGFDDLCMACITGEYPTNISGSEELEQKRKEHHDARDNKDNEKEFKGFKNVEQKNVEQQKEKMLSSKVFKSSRILGSDEIYRI